MIAMPSGDDMKMEMVGYPCPGDFTKVEADIEAIWSQVFFEDRTTVPDLADQESGFVVVQIFQAGDMS